MSSINQDICEKPATLRSEEILAFIEPLSFLQFEAERTGMQDLVDKLQECVNILYKYLPRN